MMMRKHIQMNRELDIDLTPMLNIVLLTVIFFGLVSPFTKEFGIDVRDTWGLNICFPPNMDKSILVEADSIDQLRINGHAIQQNELQPAIQSLHAANPDFWVLIKLHDESSTEEGAGHVREMGYELLPLGHYLSM
ncbi:MAG: biopolymer transporter ExbD, partial [Pseudomonadota bacterium]